MRRYTGFFFSSFLFFFFGFLVCLYFCQIISAISLLPFFCIVPLRVSFLSDWGMEGYRGPFIYFCLHVYVWMLGRRRTWKCLASRCPISRLFLGRTCWCSILTIATWFRQLAVPVLHIYLAYALVPAIADYGAGRTYPYHSDDSVLARSKTIFRGDLLHYAMTVLNISPS